MTIKASKQQRGVVTVLMIVILPVLLLAAGLALDFGHVFVNKTRLQNALDATALSAAIAINYDVTHNTAAATNKGKETFNLFKMASGNNELADLNAEDLVFEYSKTLNPWSFFDPTRDAFAFVKVTSTNMLNVTPMLIRIFRSDDIAVPAIATAGPVGQNCSLTPFVMCAEIDDITGKPDIDCSDGACFGYTIGAIRSLVIACNGNTGNCPENSLESGNYNLLDLDDSQGGKDIRETLQGTTYICKGAGNTLNTKPGWTWGNVRQGINDRFDSDSNTEPYPQKDRNGNVIIYNPSPNHQYNIIGSTNHRREIATPFGDCRGLQNGNSTIPKVGTGCVFLTEHAIQQGSEKKIMVEFLDSCEQNGVWDPNNPVLNGPYKIVLFKSPGSGDS